MSGIFSNLQMFCFMAKNHEEDLINFFFYDPLNHSKELTKGDLN